MLVLDRDDRDRFPSKSGPVYPATMMGLEDDSFLLNGSFSGA